MTTLDDWTVKLKFDSSEVDKGVRDLDKKFQKFERQKVSKIEKRFPNALIKAEIEAYKEAERRQARLAKQKIDDRNRLHKIDQQLARKEAAARKAVTPPFVGPMPQKERALTFKGRQSLENRIFSARERAQESLTKLGGMDSPESGQIRARLEAQIKRLDSVQSRLAQTTSTNNKAYERLENDLTSTQRSVRSLSKESTTLTRKFNAQKFAANGLSTSLKNMARSYLSVFAAVGALGSALRISKDFDRIRATMLLSSSSAEEAGKNFEFVSNLSERLGSDISATADAFSGFNVAAVSAGISAQESKDIFTKLATSVQATGLDAHRSGLAFLAFKQMLAGPVVQAQEMNQIVEQMPQFTGVARKALKELGHEGENFREIIATGTVQSEGFVKVVARMLEEQAVSSGAAAASQNNLIAAQNRMTKSFKEMVDTISASGLKNILMNIFGGLTDLMRGLTPLISVVVSGISLLTDVVSYALSPLNNLLKLLGFDGGLASILAGVAGFFAAGTLLKGILKITTALRQLGITAAIVKGIVGGPAGIVTALAGGTAAAIGAQALFGGGGATKEPVQQNTNTMRVDKVEVNVAGSSSSGQDIADATNAALQEQFFSFMPVK